MFRVTRRHLVVSVWMGIGLTGSSPAYAAAQLRLFPLLVSADGSGMDFRTTSAKLDAPREDQELAQIDTDNGRFRVQVDLRSVPWDNGCRCFRYVFYVQRLAGPSGGDVVRYRVQGEPRGRFDDHVARVKLEITDGGLADTGTISLPIATNLPPRDLLAEVNRGEIRRIGLQGEQTLEIRLKNTLNSLPLVLDPGAQFQARDKSLWDGDPKRTADTSEIVVQPDETRVIQVTVRPKALNALGASFPPRAPDIAHTTMSVWMNYHTESVGKLRTLAIELPIRVEPNLVTLAAFLLLGVLLGSLIPPVTGQLKGTWKQWPKAFVGALLVGIVLELVGMLLVSSNSKFILLGFDLDPFQSLPTLLLGATVGFLGFRAVSLLEHYFRESP
jgi:hypothetical protein